MKIALGESTDDLTVLRTMERKDCPPNPPLFVRCCEKHSFVLYTIYLLFLPLSLLRETIHSLLVIPMTLRGTVHMKCHEFLYFVFRCSKKRES